MEELLSVKDAAKIAGVTETSLYDAIRAGVLPSQKVLGRIGVRRADVEQYIPRNYGDRTEGKKPKGRPKKA